MIEVKYSNARFLHVSRFTTLFEFKCKLLMQSWNITELFVNSWHLFMEQIIEWDCHDEWNRQLKTMFTLCPHDRLNTQFLYTK